MASELRSLLAPNFVREDHRALVGMPTVDGDGWIEQLLTFFDLGFGSPTFRLSEVVAVRGERLALYWIEITFGDGIVDRRLGIAQYDASVELVERYVSFDDQDVDQAIVALDEMSARLAEA